MASVLVSRQGDDDLGAPARRLADGDPAAVGLDDPPGDGHAQAGPLGLGGEERLEDLVALLGVEPRPVVADGDADAGRPSSPAAGAVDLDLGGIGARGQGVLEDVAEDLLEAERVGLAAQVHAVDGSRSDGVPAPAHRLEVRPGLAARPRRGRTRGWPSLIGAA